MSPSSLAIRLLGLIAFVATSSARAAEPLLVPEFTPASPADFALAGMLGGQVRDRLLADGHIVLTEEMVSPVIGTELQNCAARPGCPSDVLPRLPARLAVVTLVGRGADGGLVGYVRLFVGADPRPALGRDLAILPGQEELFVSQVSSAVRELLAMVPPSPDTVLMAAARLISGQGLASSAAPPPPPPMASPEPEEDLDTLEPLDAPVRTSGAADTRPLDVILGDTGVKRRHVVGSERSLRESGGDPRDWVYSTSPHAGRMTVDVQAGLGLGDVERYADLRATLDADGNQLESWYQEGPFYARRPRGGIFVGYAPATWLDLGLFFGLQYSNRVLTTGVTRQRSDGSTEIIGNPPQDLQAVQVILQPRVRGYLVPLGPVKPFVFTAPEFRIFDRYKLDQSGTAPVYPIPAGGTMFGWCGGAGLLIDPGPIIGLFAEGSYTQFFGARSDRIESGAWSSPHPEAPVSRHNTIAVSGGVQFRI